MQVFLEISVEVVISHMLVMSHKIKVLFHLSADETLAPGGEFKWYHLAWPRALLWVPSPHPWPRWYCPWGGLHIAQTLSLLLVTIGPLGLCQC